VLPRGCARAAKIGKTFSRDHDRTCFATPQWESIMDAAGSEGTRTLKPRKVIDQNAPLQPNGIRAMRKRFHATKRALVLAQPNPGDPAGAPGA
jgi:hypothetical protein